MGVDLKEFDKLSSYKSLNQLFTRSLKNKREFDKDKQAFISPSDSLVSELGDMFISRTLQIKGSYYKVDDLLVGIEKENIKKIYNGKYINLYLSPKDYHRFHSPIDMKVAKAVHVPGLLYSVNLKYLEKIPDLFVKNERVILECFTNDNQLFYMIFVGALNVGKIKLNFDERIQTNCDKKEITTYYYGDVFLKKGDELGRFEMGSTIVIFFEKDMAELTVERMTKVRFGDTIAKLNKIDG
jgi:phosphatidylserine decarboxylase